MYPVNCDEDLPELIVCAANQYIHEDKPEEPITLLGIRHACDMMSDHYEDIDPKHIDLTTYKETQGFFTNKHRFVDREEGYQIAKAQNQIKRLCPTGSVKEFPELFSEMLY